MFKRWFETWRKRKNCDHEWNDIDLYISESGIVYQNQYCPLCDKQRTKNLKTLQQQRKINQIKRMYED